MRFLDVAGPYYPETQGDGTWLSLAILAVIITIIVIIVVVNKNKQKDNKKEVKKEVDESEKDIK